MAAISPRKYRQFDYPGARPGSKTLLTGIRPDHCGYLISGFYQAPQYGSGPKSTSFVYQGALNGKGKFYNLNFPIYYGSKTPTFATQLYGPDPLPNGDIRVVGSYINADGESIGCLYQGPLNGSGRCRRARSSDRSSEDRARPERWTSLIPLSTTPVSGVIAHSTNKGYVVGNYFAGVFKGFVYEIKTGKYFDIVPESPRVSITAYGIAKNGENQYTICGSADGEAYLVNFDPIVEEFYSWSYYHYQNLLNTITHFDGLSVSCDGVITLTGDATIIGSDSEVAFGATVRMVGCENFEHLATWETIEFPGSSQTSGNSVSGGTIIGVYVPDNDQITVHGYVAESRKI